MSASSPPPCCRLNTNVLIYGYMRELANEYNQMNYPFDVNTIIIKWFHESHYDHVRRFAKQLWKSLPSIPFTDTVIYQGKIIKAMTGSDLIDHIEENMQPNIKAITLHGYVIQACDQLLTNKFIRCAHEILLVPRLRHDYSIIPDNRSKNETFEASGFYQFEGDKYMEFVKEECHDRRAWIIGTTVEIYCSRWGGWKMGKVQQFHDNDMVTVVYGSSDENLMRKQVNRYQADMIMSTKQFIEIREEWSEGSMVDLYVHQDGIWVEGKIEAVLTLNKLRVSYGDTGNEWRIMDRWSPEIQVRGTGKGTALGLDMKVSKYEVGTKVVVWSNSKKGWFVGVVIDVDMGMDTVTVRYGDLEKTVSANSAELRLSEAEGGNEGGWDQRYQLGTQVMVWSNSQSVWIPGVVIKVIKEHEMVTVRYGDYEKSVPIISRNIKLMKDVMSYPSFI